MLRMPSAASSVKALNRCAQLMWGRACGSVPVIDELGRPLSIVTDRDICMAAYIQGKPLAEIGVESAMSKRLFTVRTSDRVLSAERTMRVHGVRRLLVVDQHGVLVGLLSIDDILVCARLGARGSRDAFSEAAIAETVQGLRHSVRGIGAP